mgnify:CR=1 FL=1
MAGGGRDNGEANSRLVNEHGLGRSSRERGKKLGGENEEIEGKGLGKERVQNDEQTVK